MDINNGDTRFMCNSGNNTIKVDDRKDTEDIVTANARHLLPAIMEYMSPYDRAMFSDALGQPRKVYELPDMIAYFKTLRRKSINMINSGSRVIDYMARYERTVVENTILYNRIGLIHKPDHRFTYIQNVIANINHMNIMPDVSHTLQLITPLFYNKLKNIINIDRRIVEHPRSIKICITFKHKSMDKHGKLITISGPLVYNSNHDGNHDFHYNTIYIRAGIYANICGFRLANGLEYSELFSISRTIYM